MTSWEDFAGIVVPIAIALLITWLPKITGDFIETQARDLATQLERGGFGEAIRNEVQESAASFARGSTLAAGAIASIVSYVCGTLGAIPRTAHQPFWVWIAAIWGVVALLYLFITFTTHKLFQLDELYLRNPLSRTRAFTAVTHYQAVTWVLTLSSLMIALIACDAKFLSSASQSPAANPAEGATLGTAPKVPHPR